VLALVTLLLSTAPAPALAQTACEFAMRGAEREVIVGFRGPGGTELRVSWGDGAVSTSPPTEGQGGRVRLSHIYGASGTYALSYQASAPSIECTMGAEIQVPYRGADDRDTLDVLGEPGGSAPEDRSTGQSEGQAQRRRAAGGADGRFGATRRTACGMLGWLGLSSGC
jgi:hypothetical protein